MRIAVLYNQDVYALKALNRLLPSLTQHTLHLFHSSRVGRATNNQPAPLNDLMTIEHALIRQFSGRPPGQHRLGFDELADCFDLTDVPLNDVNQPSGLARLRHFQPDLMVSIRFGKILGAHAIACADRGVINLHSGLLPDYRGVMPTFWAMLSGEVNIGMTLHWVPDATIDTGPIIGRTTHTCDLEASYIANVWQLYDPGVDLMLQAVSQIETGDLQAETAVAGDATGRYFTFPDASALALFREQGLKLHDPSDRGLAD